MRYVFIGCLAYFIELCVLFSFSHLLKLSPTISVGISFWVGLIVAFILQKIFAFKNNSKHKKTVALQIVLYLILVAFNYIFTLLFVHFTESLIGLFASRTIALIITTLWNFLIYKRVIFRETPFKLPKLTFTKSLLLLFMSLSILIVSSVFVSQRTAVVHSYNHDQIINGYLFEDHETFNEAVFPGAHSQLIKWPVFFVISLAGNSERVLYIATILTYLATVLGLLVFVYIISNRNIKVTSIIGLVMSSSLALVPPQPIPGKLLPVNAAMITTRNLEYIIFMALMALLVLLAKHLKVNFKILLAALVGLILLGASDKLFIVLPVCVLMVVLVGSIVLNRNLRHTIHYLTPFLVACAAWAGCALLIRLINLSDITTITESSTPFPFITSASELITAAKYLVKSIGMNFGAVPPPEVSMFSFQAIPYFFNGFILVVSSVASIFVLQRWIKALMQKKYDFSLNLAAWLSIASLGTMALYSLTTHEYQSDARYVSLYFFSSILCLAYSLNYILTGKRYGQLVLKSASIVLIAMVPFVMLASREQFKIHTVSTEQIIGTGTQIAQDRLTEKNVDLLVGDFWFSTVARLKSGNEFLFLPMSTGACETPNEVLNSDKWRMPKSSVDRSAVYILSDGNNKTYNHGCSLAYLTQLYGVPEDEILLRGSSSKPVEVIRIYNYDVRTKITN